MSDHTAELARLRVRFEDAGTRFPTLNGDFLYDSEACRAEWQGHKDRGTVFKSQGGDETRPVLPQEVLDETPPYRPVNFRRRFLKLEECWPSVGGWYPRRGKGVGVVFYLRMPQADRDAELVEPAALFDQLANQAVAMLPEDEHLSVFRPPCDLLGRIARDCGRVHSWNHDRPFLWQTTRTTEGLAWWCAHVPGLFNAAAAWLGRILPAKKLADADTAPLPVGVEISATPDEVLVITGWADIISAVNELNPEHPWENTTSHVKVLKRFNTLFDGPIRVGRSRGKRPTVNKPTFVRWWNDNRQRFISQLEDTAVEERTAAANVENTYQYGRTGTAAPELNGGVKARRKSGRRIS